MQPSASLCGFAGKLGEVPDVLRLLLCAFREVVSTDVSATLLDPADGLCVQAAARYGSCAPGGRHVLLQPPQLAVRPAQAASHQLPPAEVSVWLLELHTQLAFKVCGVCCFLTGK